MELTKSHSTDHSMLSSELVWSMFANFKLCAWDASIWKSNHIMSITQNTWVLNAQKIKWPTEKLESFAQTIWTGWIHIFTPSDRCQQLLSKLTLLTSLSLDLWDIKQDAFTSTEQTKMKRETSWPWQRKDKCWLKKESFLHLSSVLKAELQMENNWLLSKKVAS